MNQPNEGSGLPSNVPGKRKRGRPRKYDNLVRGESMSGNKTTDDSMVGKAVTGIVEGTFGAGYLLNVKVAEDTDDTPLRGLVFEPGQVIPVTPDNDVAPHLKMIKRTELPIPVLPNTQTEVHGSVPSSMPMSEEQLPPTEIHSRVSVSVENELPKDETSIMAEPEKKDLPPTEIHSGISVSVEKDLPMNETSIMAESVSEEYFQPNEIHSGISVSVEKDLPMNDTSIMSEPDIMSKLEPDKTDKQGDTLLELDASTKVRESTADGGVIRDSRTASPTIEDADKELRTEQQSDTLHDGGGTRDSRPVSPTIEDTDKELRTEQQSDTLHELDVDTSTKGNESTADGDGEATKDYSRPASDSISLVQAIEDIDKKLRTEQQGDTLQELDASTKEKESSADGDEGATREYSRPASDIVSLVQTTEDTAKELRTEQQAMPSVNQLNELVHKEPVRSNIEIPVSAGPESKQSEEISKSVDNIREKQLDSPKTDLLDTKTETDLPIVD